MAVMLVSKGTKGRECQTQWPFQKQKVRASVRATLAIQNGFSDNTLCSCLFVSLTGRLADLRVCLHVCVCCRCSLCCLVFNLATAEQRNEDGPADGIGYEIGCHKQCVTLLATAHWVTLLAHLDHMCESCEGEGQQAAAGIHPLLYAYAWNSWVQGVNGNRHP